MKKIFIIILFLLSVPAYAFDLDENTTIRIYKNVLPAIVCVDSQLYNGMSCGSGCIIDKSGIILTSAHVVDSGEHVVVTIYNGQNYPAKIIKKFGEKNDIVLLKIDVDFDLKTVKLGNSEKIKVGQKVLAIGNPFGFNGTLTKGIISRVDYANDKIQTDAAINPGSSGGPLINKNGEIIGINQAIFNPDNNISNIGIGFAIPINTIKDYLKGKNIL